MRRRLAVVVFALVMVGCEQVIQEIYTSFRCSGERGRCSSRLIFNICRVLQRTLRHVIVHLLAGAEDQLVVPCRGLAH